MSDKDAIDFMADCYAVKMAAGGYEDEMLDRVAERLMTRLLNSVTIGQKMMLLDLVVKLRKEDIYGRTPGT